MTFSMRHYRLIALFVVGVVTIFAVRWAFIVPSRAALSKEQTKSVAVVKVERADLVRSASFSAELNPFEQADLHAKVAGYLKSISVDIGDRVKRGQELATLEIPELGDELAHAEAAYHDESLNYERIRKVVAARPGLLAQADVDKAEASFEMAKANRQRAATMLAYAKIVAPFDGTVTKRYVDPGALVQAGTASNSQALPVVQLAEDSVLRLTFPVPETLVPQVAIGTPVEVSIAATGQKISSKIVRATGKLDTSTRTMETEVDIPNPDHRLTPGMYAQADVILERRNNVLTLPIQAVATGDKPTVWVVDSKGNVQERTVTLGMQTDKRVEILSGINEGEQVIFGSRSTLTLGAHVTPRQVVAG